MKAVFVEMLPFPCFVFKTSDIHGIDFFNVEVAFLGCFELGSEV